MKKIISIILAITVFLSSNSIFAFAQEPQSICFNNLETLPDNIKAYVLNHSNSTDSQDPQTKKSTYFLADLFKKIPLKVFYNFGNLLNECDFSGTHIIDKSKDLFSKSIFFSIATTGFILLDSFSSRSRGIFYTLCSYDWLKSKIYDIADLTKKLIPKKTVSPQETIKKLNKELEALKGQKLAKEKIQKIIYGIIHGKNQAKFNKEKYSHGDVLYFTGASGVGKSFAAEHIAKALSNSNPFIISASEIDVASTSTIVDQLFGLQSYGSDYGMSIKDSSCLVKYLERNKDGIVIINEYDKMWSPSLDEIMRTITDQGVISVKGQIIDCSSIIFIITSNESSGSVNGGNQEIDKKIDDGTGSRTTIKHDKSFLNRIKVVEFENLTETNYEEIARAEYHNNFTNYWLKFAGIELYMGDTFQHVAKRTANENKGSRTIKNIMDGLIKELANTVISPEFNNNCKNTKIFVSYNEDTDTFTLKIIPKITSNT
ncbi:MAG: hypothetical protein RUMPE_00372 [Eubacteriales bacterium SKADARSKE-1]|nr:hypothetical protein [Eubacteriales bacterium SKADARSKE-1]